MRMDLSDVRKAWVGTLKMLTIAVPVDIIVTGVILFLAIGFLIGAWVFGGYDLFGDL